MELRSYIDVQAFAQETRAELESNEAANSLMLGICGQLVRYPGRSETPPCFRKVEDGGGLVLAAVMTPPHKLVVYGHQGDFDRGARLLVEDLLRRRWRLPGVLGPSDVAHSVAEAWTEVTARVHVLERRQRVYELREVLVPVPERGQLRPAVEADLALVARWRYAFHQEIFGQADEREALEGARFRLGAGDLYLWEDERPVSMAMKTRPARRGISVSLVYTPVELRRRGYATACVGELSRLLLREGWEFCALFADLSNPTPNHLYQGIGYRPVCDYDEYAFREE